MRCSPAQRDNGVGNIDGRQLLCGQTLSDCLTTVVSMSLTNSWFSSQSKKRCNNYCRRHSALPRRGTVRGIANPTATTQAIATCAKIEKSAPRSDNLNKIERLTPKPVNFLGFKFSRWRNLGLEEPRLIGRQRWEMSRPQCPFDGWSTPNSWLVRRPSIAMIRKKHWPNFLRRPRS